MKLPSGKIKLWDLTICLIFFINPFVDAITGFIVLSDESAVGGLGSPSQLFRLLLSVLMIIQIRKRSHLMTVLLFIIYLICLELFNFAFHADPTGLIVGVTYSYKTVFGLLMYFMLDKYLKNNVFSFDKLIEDVIVSGVIYSAIVLISDLAGISFGAYGADIGSRGVFASANGLGIYVGVCSLVVIFRYYNRPNYKYLLFYALMAYVMLGLMTRAAIGMLIIGLFLWFFRLSWKLKVPVLSFVAIVVCILWDPIFQIIIASTEMISYRFANSDMSLHTLFIGGRQFLFDRAANEFTYDGFLWYRIIIGGGYFLSFRNPFNINYSISSILEADAWDVFYMFGIVGVIIYVLLLVYPFTFKTNVKGSTGYILKIAWVMIFFHSALAGHVIQSGQSVMVMVCLILMIKYKKNEKLI